MGRPDSDKYTPESSLARHSKRCHPGCKAPSRQKSCSHCVRAKVRCDLVRPRCGRCIARSLVCEFAAGTSRPDPCALQEKQPDSVGLSGSASSSASSGPTPPDALASGPPSVASERTFASFQAGGLRWRSPPDITAFDPSKYSLPERQRQQLTGGPAHDISFTAIAGHTARFGLRTVKSWARLLAVHGTAHLPPMMHKCQFSCGTPGPLANCLTLLSMWGSSTPENAQVVHDTILAEVKRLLGSVSSSSPFSQATIVVY